MATKSQDITQAELKKELFYDPKTGFFTWKITNRTKVKGNKTGKLTKSGYYQIRFKNTYFYAHRLAWLYVYGINPDGEIDHINRDKADNRITNLRLCTRSQNLMNRKQQTNNTTGHAGIYYSKVMNKWCARGKVEGKNKHLGSYATKEEAGGVADAFRRREFEDFYTPHESVNPEDNSHYDDVLENQFILGNKKFSAKRNIMEALASGQARYHGVQYCKSSDKWVSRCKMGSKRVSLGSYATREEAQTIADLFKQK
jgi:hypothetical protein